MMLLDILYVAGAFLGGAVTGYAFFTALRVNVSLYTNSRVGRAIMLHFIRMIFSVAAFVGFAALGTLTLIVSLAGFLFARHIVTRPEKETAFDINNLSQVYQL